MSREEEGKEPAADASDSSKVKKAESSSYSPEKK
jgi:hypothetical protein